MRFIAILKRKSRDGMQKIESRWLSPVEPEMLSEQLLGDDHPLDLVGALVDLGARFRRSSWLPPVC
jgi:hypothetical protein